MKKQKSIVVCGFSGEVAIDNPGTGYSVGTDLYFNNANTEGSGASAKITCVGGAIAVEKQETLQYGMDTFDHIVYEDATEADDFIQVIRYN